MRGRYPSEAQAQARAMLAIVDDLHPGAVNRLRSEPLAELMSWGELTVSVVAETPGAEGCSVAGSYLHDPPTLVVASSKSYRRRGFTALHELGHHLQQTELDLGSKIFQYHDPERFEEEACDAFAAQVLLPDTDLEGKIDRRGPVAQDVVDLFAEHSSASREACCVWGARHLRGSGVVILLDRAGTVLFAAPRSCFPPGKGSDQSDTPLIAAALRTSGTGASSDDTHIQYRDGRTSDSLYGDARWFDDEYLVAILVADNAAWRPLALPRPDTARGGSARWWTCETCEHTFPATDRCERCHDPRCPDGHCGCDAARAAKDRLCTACFLTLHPSRFDAGCDTCKECS